jgi:hypothetical protein
MPFAALVKSRKNRIFPISVSTQAALCIKIGLRTGGKLDEAIRRVFPIVTNSQRFLLVIGYVLALRCFSLARRGDGTAPDITRHAAVGLGRSLARDSPGQVSRRGESPAENVGADKVFRDYRVATCNWPF